MPCWTARIGAPVTPCATTAAAATGSSFQTRNGMNAANPNTITPATKVPSWATTDTSLLRPMLPIADTPTDNANVITGLQMINANNISPAFFAVSRSGGKTIIGHANAAENTITRYSNASRTYSTTHRNTIANSTS